MNGAAYILSFLKEKHVGTVFAYPGSSVLPLYAALCGSGIRVVLARHEQGAAHEAVGYAKATGLPGVVVATSGPGATNLVTGIADAYLDSAPLLVITGQVASGAIGRDAFQEADIMGITIPVTKHNYLIKKPDDLPCSLEEAYRVATFPRMGPVLVDITGDVFDAEIPAEATRFECLLPRHHQNDFRLRQAALDVRAALEKAEKPLLLVGGGVAAAGASESLRALAGAGHIPVVVTMMGRAVGAGDGFPELVGMAGVYGTREANEALADCDLLLAVGTRFSDRTVPDAAALEKGRTIVHADPDSAELAKNVRADICVCCGAVRMIEMLRAILADLPEEKKNTFAAFAAKHTAKSREKGVFGTLCGVLAAYEAAHPGTRVVADVGLVQTALARGLALREERAFVTSGGLGAMGFGLPAAIGAAYALADTGRAAEGTRVITVAGDGAFQMTAHELPLLRRVPVPVKAIVLDNGSLGMVAELPNGKGGVYDLPDNPDFAALAAAYGVPAAAACAGDGGLAAALDAFLASPGSGVFVIAE
ncbi:MAG: thiamine pyrophosphate-binding protein [Clostridia bacterium]|nr:thiamine pyrophosphate-binding protein [Clostridia bacterium]